MAINTLNQSLTLSVREENRSKTYKRIKPLDSDLFVNSSVRVLISNKK